MRRRSGNKFNARKTEIDGYRFASVKEGGRYWDLLMLQRAGDVKSFRVHPEYRLVVNGKDIGKMTLDFEVIWANGEITIEDVKGGRATKTEAYSLRKRVFEACHAPLVVTEL